MKWLYPYVQVIGVCWLICGSKSAFKVICNSVMFLYNTNEKKSAILLLFLFSFLQTVYNKHQRDRDNNHCLHVLAIRTSVWDIK